MTGAGGMAPIVLRLPDTSNNLPASMRSGQSLRGTVVETSEGLAVQVGGNRLALPDGAALTGGQKVEVALRREGGGYEIRIAPNDSAGTAAAPASEKSIEALVSSVIRSLGRVAGAGSVPSAALIPRGLPLTEQAVRLLLGLFTSRGRLGSAFSNIEESVRAGKAAGVLAADSADDLLDLLERLLVRQESRLQKSIERLARTMAKSTEARLAQHAKSPSASATTPSLSADLRARLSSLKNDQAFQKFLVATGRIGDFEGHIEHALDRMTGAHLQNARALEHPYLFLELPMAPGGLVESAQLHIFEDGGHDGHEGARAPETVVMDLETTHLGPLWISVRTAGPICRCEFRAMTAEAVEAITESSGELVRGLESAGYGRAHVEASLWKGDRLSAVVELMRRFAGIDVSA